MLDQITRFFLKNRVFSGLLLILVIAFGVMHSPFNTALSWIPLDPLSVDAIPDIGENQQIVYTLWEGHSPKDIENQITYPLTVALLGLPGVKNIRSHSMFGRSGIYLIFEEGQDFYWCRSRILEKLNALPDNLLPEQVTPRLGPDATALGQIFWYTLEGRDSLGEPTGGWDLEELRTVQDFYVKYGLMGANDVSEVASVGGFVKEYQIDMLPEAMKASGVTLKQLVHAVKSSNRDVGAKTLEINRTEYFIRGLGYIRDLNDIEETVIKTVNSIPIRVKDIARVSIGPAERRGILDKGGAEAVGGVVVARFGTNPMQVIKGIKNKIKEISPGLPSKRLSDGRKSQLTIVPFYDRSELIEESISTLSHTLLLEIFLTILVIVVVLRHFKASLLIAIQLPLAILGTFALMKYLDVQANIVALAGIAIAIGSVVDMSIVLIENIVKRLETAPSGEPLLQTISTATKEVSSAILTAAATTIVSFLPIFSLQASEGKLFTPLALTKTFTLGIAALAVITILPVLAYTTFSLKPNFKKFRFPDRFNRYAYPLMIALLLAAYSYLWKPLGEGASLIPQIIFAGLIIGGVIFTYQYFLKKYSSILNWCLDNRKTFLAIPFAILILGGIIWKNSGKEFLPSLDEGSFLLMPSSMPHAGIEENHELLQLIDRAVTNIPEVEYAVGKLGRVESALDPAPISMFEILISYQPEFGKDELGNQIRNWRAHIRSADDIWNEISTLVAQIPGLTIPPKLQPIETRLVMLQTGLRAPLGILVKGRDSQKMEQFSLDLERHMKAVEGIRSETVFAERTSRKPYLEISVDRQKAARHNLSIDDVLTFVEIALGGKAITQTVEESAGYNVRVRYQRDHRDSPAAIGNMLIPVSDELQIPLSEVADIDYRQGEQVIKSEDGFLVQYLIFKNDKNTDEVTAVENAQKYLNQEIEKGNLIVPAGVSYSFGGNYESHLRASKRMRLVIIFTLLIILSILYFQFRSLALSLIVFCGVFVAFAGGFILLWLFGQDWFFNIPLAGSNLRDLFSIQTIYLSTAVWVGFLILFGMSTDDGVLVATFLKQEAQKEGLKTKEQLRKIILSAGNRRVRPAVLTTVTTILALLPILTSTGKGSDLMTPMAVPVLGGMIFQTITIFIVPVLYSFWQEYKLETYE